MAEIEFRTSGDNRWPIVTYDGKWSTGSDADRATPVRCPANVDESLAGAVETQALTAFQITGCRDYAGVDLRVDREGNIFILEVNAGPDAGPNAGLARALKAAGIEYRDFATPLVATAHRARYCSQACRFTEYNRRPRKLKSFVEKAVRV